MFEQRKLLEVPNSGDDSRNFCRYISKLKNNNNCIYLKIIKIYHNFKKSCTTVPFGIV